MKQGCGLGKGRPQCIRKTEEACDTTGTRQHRGSDLYSPKKHHRTIKNSYIGKCNSFQVPKYYKQYLLLWIICWVLFPWLTQRKKWSLSWETESKRLLLIFHVTCVSQSRNQKQYHAISSNCLIPMNPARRIKTCTAKSSGDIFADILISLFKHLYLNHYW